MRCLKDFAPRSALPKRGAQNEHGYYSNGDYMFNDYSVINIRKGGAQVKKYIDECCDCAVPGYPCPPGGCDRRHVPHYYCDKCGEEATLYDYEGAELCGECLLDTVPTVEGSAI